jgi:hypothetical protein
MEGKRLFWVHKPTTAVDDCAQIKTGYFAVFGFQGLAGFAARMYANLRFVFVYMCVAPQLGVGRGGCGATHLWKKYKTYPTDVWAALPLGEMIRFWVL